MFKTNPLCAVALHMPKLNEAGNRFTERHEYYYSCARDECKWRSEVWKHGDPPRALTRPMRIFGLSVPTVDES
jgi:hypothetical protein